MKALLDELKKTTVFFGREDDQGNIVNDPQTGYPQFFATGILINARSVFHLVTAKHVVFEKKEGKFTGRINDEGVRIFFNLKSGKIGSRSLKETKDILKGNWISHVDPNVDVAIIPFGLNPENDDIKTLQQELFYSDEVPELLDVFYLAYQPGTIHINRISPIFRNGVVSLINEDATFYIDGSAFPGNSGSPVFVKPVTARFDKDGNISLGNDPIGGKFLGIVGEYLPYNDIAVSMQTGQARIIFQENTGLSRIWPIKFIDEILDLPNSKKQIEDILSLNRKEKVGI